MTASSPNYHMHGIKPEAEPQVSWRDLLFRPAWQAPLALSQGCGFSAELGSDYGSEDFVRRYEAALEGHRTRGGVGAGRAKPGSVGLLVSKWYRSQDFLALEASTQRVYRGVVESFRHQHGSKPVHMMQLVHC